MPVERSSENTGTAMTAVPGGEPRGRYLDGHGGPYAARPHARNLIRRGGPTHRSRRGDYTLLMGVRHAH